MRTIEPVKKLGINGLYTLIFITVVISASQYLLSNYTGADNSFNTQLLYTAIVIVIIVGSFMSVILPEYKKVYASFEELIKSEESAKNMASEVSKLYDELGKSYQDLESVNLVSDEPELFLKANANGDIVSIQDSFKDILGIKTEEFHINFYDWLKAINIENDFELKIKTLVNSGKSWNGEINTSNEDGDLIWLDLVIQPVSDLISKNLCILLIGREVTDINEARERSREINREVIEKRVKEQQYRSALILEGQEEERKRIAQEIHDGIGQMLTALKLNLEGVTASNAPHMRQRISDTKHLMKSVIKEVRRVSFNLSPSSLVDFGMVPAMKKISQEVSALTDTQVTFENKSEYVNRLDNNIETNIYRIVQEAVNNGIKYAKADNINISFEHNPNRLLIKIKDNGKGFELKKLANSGHFGASGHGIFNMKERAAYINAKFDIESEINQGTTISLTVPLI